MTREEAIIDFETFKKHDYNQGFLSSSGHIEIAIEAMKQMEEVDRIGMFAAIYGIPSQEPCEDAISREAVSQAVNDLIAEYIPLMDGAMEMMPLDVAKAIMRVPSVTVRQTGCDKCAMNNSGSKYCDNCKYKRQTGEWIDGKCSMCGEHAPYWSMATTYYESKFCPNCGCRMVKEGESE